MKKINFQRFYSVKIIK